MCARAGRETEQTQRERERERGVCARWESKTGHSQKLGLGGFLKGKKSLKGSAMLLSWQHCASPFLQLRVGPQVKQKIRCVNRAVNIKGVVDWFFSMLDCVYGVQSSMCSCLFFFKKRIIFHIIYLYSTPL